MIYNNNRGDKILINEERKLLADTYEKGYKTKDLSEIFKISVNSVNRIIRQKKRTGPCKLHVNLKHVIVEENPF